MAEHVIFRHDPDHQPQLAFRGVPSGCAGGANTLAEARASYRMCLCERLHVDRRELPRSSSTSRDWSAACGCGPESVQCIGIRQVIGCCCRSC